MVRNQNFDIVKSVSIIELLSFHKHVFLNAENVTEDPMYSTCKQIKH